MPLHKNHHEYQLGVIYTDMVDFCQPNHSRRILRTLMETVNL